MKTSSHMILRFTLAITFAWVGYLILQNPEAWAGYMHDWATELLPLPVVTMMQITAVADIAIGAMFLIAPLVWIGGLLGGLHMLVILVTSGITDITVRDIAILGACVALMLDSWPKRNASPTL